MFSGRREDLECTGQLFNCDFSRIILFQKLVHLKPYISTLLLVQICGGWREIFKHSICNYVIVIHWKVKVRRSAIVFVQTVPQKTKIPQSNKFNVKERKLNLRIYWRWLNFELWPAGQCEMVKLKKWLLVNIVYWPVMLEWFHSGIVCWSINIVGAAVFSPL